MRETLRQNKGITLIALVITVIVLLILAGIAIVALTGDNGILTRATDARAANALGEAKDACAIIVAEQTEAHYRDMYVNQSSSDLDTKIVTALRAKEGNGNLVKDVNLSIPADSTGTGTVITLTYTDTYSSKVEGTVRNGIIEWDELIHNLEKIEQERLEREAQEAAERAAARAAFISTVNTAITSAASEGTISPDDLKTTLATYFTTESMTAIASLDLTDSTVQTGTTIIATEANGGYEVAISELLTGITVANQSTGITGLTDTSGTTIIASNITTQGQDFKMGDEQFKVINNPTTDGKVVAIAWYNLKLDASTIRQATEAEATAGSEGVVKFVNSSSDVTWSAGEDNITVDATKSDVQKHINAYQATLPSGVTARMTRYSEMNATGMTYAIRNPGQKGRFWLGSASSDNASFVHRVDNYRQRLLQQRVLHHPWCPPCNRVL